MGNAKPTFVSSMLLPALKDKHTTYSIVSNIVIPLKNLDDLKTQNHCNVHDNEKKQ